MKLFVAVACAIAAAGLHLATSAAAVRISDAEETGVIRSAGSVGEDADPTSPTPLCGLDGFDIVLLAFPPYWRVDISTQMHTLCNNEEDLKACRIYFSICKPVRAVSPLGCSEDAAVCLEVELNNGTTQYRSIGDSSTETFHVDLDTGSGFYSEWQTTATSTTCPNGARTSIAFECSDSSKWNPEQADVTDHLHSATFFNVSGCHYILHFYYYGACYITPTIAPNLCTVEGYNISQLARPEYWLTDPSTHVCVGSAPSANGTTPITRSCVFHLSFCRAVPWTNTDKNCYDSSACQQVEYANGNKTSYSMGAFSKNTKFVPNDANDGFHLELKSGTSTYQCIPGLTSMINFECEPKATWSTGAIDSKWVEVVYNQENHCQYTINLKWENACKSTRTPIAGWILIGIILGAVAIYLVVGMAIQYFVNKKRGVEVVPNYTFWKAFLLYAYGGCKWTFNIVTCYSLSDKKGKTATGLTGMKSAHKNYDAL